MFRGIRNGDGSNNLPLVVCVCGGGGGGEHVDFLKTKVLGKRSDPLYIFCCCKISLNTTPPPFLKMSFICPRCSVPG